MKIFNIEEYFEKIKIDPISLSDLDKIRKSSDKSIESDIVDFLQTHLKTDYNYKFINDKFIVNYYVKKFNFSDESSHIDFDHANNVVTLSSTANHFWAITPHALDKFYKKFSYKLLFNQNDFLQIHSGGQSHSQILSSNVDFINALSENNHFSEVSFWKIIIDIPLKDLTSRCWIGNIDFLNCQFNESCIAKNDVIGNSLNKDIFLTSPNRNTQAKLKRLGYNW